MILLLALAVLLGYVTDFGLVQWEHHLYPIDFSEQVTEYARQYDLNEYMVYALIKELSNFQSNHVSEDGRIGLMQLSKETFLWLTQDQLGEHLDAGLLYEPSTNIRYGCYYLLYLTTRYESWDAVLAAYLRGTDIVDRWYEEWELTRDETMPEFVIPDEITRENVSKIQRIIDKYQELYK